MIEFAKHAKDFEIQKKKSNYPEPFASKVNGREKRPLGDLYGLNNFGVNLTVLKPNSMSALLHRHSKQDEFVYIIKGNPTLVTEEGEQELSPGMCAGFPADGTAHQLINNTDENVEYLEIGDRSEGDEASYPKDDLVANLVDGKWVFTDKAGNNF